MHGPYGWPMGCLLRGIWTKLTALQRHRFTFFTDFDKLFKVAKYQMLSSTIKSKTVLFSLTHTQICSVTCPMKLHILCHNFLLEIYFFINEDNKWFNFLSIHISMGIIVGDSSRISFSFSHLSATDQWSSMECSIRCAALNPWGRILIWSVWKDIRKPPYAADYPQNTAVKKYQNTTENLVQI